jgi:Tol biopolymer transport system component
MPDQGGKGIYYVNGRDSGSLTAYQAHSKQSTDIVPDGGFQPIISRDGKRVMYTTVPTSEKVELWTSDIDGGNKAKITTRGTQEESLLTLNWAPDNFHLSFSQGSKLYVVGTDGSDLRQLPSMAGMKISNTVWSPDQKTVYVSAVEGALWYSHTIWKWSDGSNPEKLVEKCGFAYDIDPGGKYLLALVPFGEKTGVYEVSISERKCVPLLPGVATGTIFAPDGKSLLYVVGSRGEVAIYRQPWKNGKVIGTPQVELKLPFTFPLNYGSTYDFSKDLSTIVYARPGGHADLYLLSEK